MYNEMASWRFLGATNLKFVGSWRMTLRGKALLWLDLQAEGYTYLPVGNLTSDCIENFNASLRDVGGHRHNPSCKDLPSTFGAAMTNQLSNSMKGKNCRDENSLNLIHLQGLFNAAEAAACSQTDSCIWTN
jgi:hypothetical protein